MSLRYEEVRLLGAGGMAEVVLARVRGPADFEKRVVIKRVLPHLVGDAQLTALFEREARLSALLEHPNLVQVSDFGRDDAGRPFLVMEFVDGGSLRDLLIARGPPRAEDVRLLARVFAQAAEGLGAAHATLDPTTGQPLNLVHRDVSPDNILVARTGAVKVSDFGIARAMTQGSQTAPNILRGKLHYLAPEQITGAPVSAPADQWALGISLFEAFAGTRPFDRPNDGATMFAIVNGQRPTLGELAPGVPPELERIVSRCLAIEPRDRWPDCRAVAEALDGFVHGSGAPISNAAIGAWVEQVLPGSRPAPPSASAIQPVQLGERLNSPSARGRTPVEQIVEPSPLPGAATPDEAQPEQRRRRWVAAVGVLLAMPALGWLATHRSAPSAAQLVVSSAPSGGRVEIDGRPVGTTPWAGDVSLTHMHEVVVTMAGYATFTTTIDAGVSTSVEATLKRR